MTLTGRYRHRLGWRDTLVLQVEVQVVSYVARFARRQPGNDVVEKISLEWRDARVEDMSAPLISGLSAEFVTRARNEYLGVRPKKEEAD